MGASAGGFKAFTSIVAALPPGFPLPLLLVQHLHQDDNGAFAAHLGTASKIPVIEPCDKDQIKCGNVYIAPAGYHLLVEQGGTIALSTEEKVNWSRPSIDVLFESAARLWGKRVVAVIMSGASSDGTVGIQAIKATGGMTIAQNPDTAEYPFMPHSAINSGAVDEVLTIEEIIARIAGLGLATD
jgi:two-component system chemotaxis response regulator CheB